MLNKLQLLIIYFHLTLFLVITIVIIFVIKRYLDKQKEIESYSGRILGDYQIPWYEYKSMVISDMYWQDIVWIAMWHSVPAFIEKGYPVSPDFTSIPRKLYRGQTHFRVVINGLKFWTYEKILMEMFDELKIKSQGALDSVREGLEKMDLTGSLYEIYASHYKIKIVHSKQIIRLSFLSDIDAKLLNLKKFDPVMHIEGTLYSEDYSSVEYEEDLWNGTVFSFYVESSL